VQQSCRRKSFAELTGARYIGYIPYRFSVSPLLDTLYAAISIHLYCRDIKHAAMYNLLDYILQESAIVEEQHTSTRRLDVVDMYCIEHERHWHPLFLPARVHCVAYYPLSSPF
jgi:hypothetical protein